MGEATDDVKREIEDTRNDLGETIDAIGDRVIPGRVIERRKNQMSQGVRSAVDRVMGKAQDARQAVGSAGSSVSDAPDAVLAQTQGAPLIAGALAFAAGFLVAAAFPPSQAEKDVVDEKVAPVKEQLTQAGREVAEHLKEPATEAVQSVKSAAQEATQQVTATAKDAADQTKGDVQGAVQDVRSGD